MINRPKHKFQMYQQIHQNLPKINQEAKKAGEELGIPKELVGKIGATGAVSGFPGLLSAEVSKAMQEAYRTPIALSRLVNDLRDLIKDGYGDEYDAVPISTCEAALWVSFDVLATPPVSGRGDPYRSRYIAPLERHLHHQGGYGRPFPPKYKAMIANRGVTSGELGMEGKRQNYLDTVIVPLAGAKYEVHGIKYHVAPLLAEVDAEASREVIACAAERHKQMLAAFASLGYDTPGYGYGDKDENGTPKLQKVISKLAREYDVPYLTDNAWGVPFVGTDLRKTGADLMAFSMDKAAGAPTSGLIVGKEDVMVPIRSALGMHSDRYGGVSAYGKAEYVITDPGKENIVGQIAALRSIKEHPDAFRRPIDDLYKLVQEEFASLNGHSTGDGLMISKSYNSGAVEVNYQKTWSNGRFGIPIFTIEDFYAGTEAIMSAMKQMGLVPTISYDANIMISPGLGTLDEDGNLIKENMRYAVKGLVRAIEIVSQYAGILEVVSR
jgi:Aminotransferase class-V